MTSVLRLSAGESFDPASVLKFNLGLPSNLRFALNQQQLQLVADIRGDDPPQLLDEIATAAQFALAQQTPERESSECDLDKQEVNELLHSLSRHEELLVGLEEGWEYRPRVRGQPIAVKLNIRGRHLRCHRAVVQLRADGESNRAAAIEALRFNAQVKHARLALNESRLVAETCLPGFMLAPEALSIALRLSLSPSVGSSLL